MKLTYLEIGEWLCRSRFWHSFIYRVFRSRGSFIADCLEK